MTVTGENLNPEDASVDAVNPSDGEQQRLDSSIPALMREDMISKAVDFLRNPKVRDSPLDQKKSFLSKKGLSDVEIEQAVMRSGVNQTLPSTRPSHQTLIVAQRSRYQLIRDVISTAVMIGGLGYGIYLMLKKFMPHVFPASKEDKQLQRFNESVQELHDSINKMANQQEKQNAILKQFAEREALTKGSYEMNKITDSQQFSDIKTEIVSLKGLLLSRRQFPPTPVSQPVIPAWQLSKKTSAKSNEKVVDDSSQITGDSDTSMEGVSTSNDAPDTQDMKNASQNPEQCTDKLSQATSANEMHASLNDCKAECSDGTGSFFDTPLLNVSSELLANDVNNVTQNNMIEAS